MAAQCKPGSNPHPNILYSAEGLSVACRKIPAAVGHFCMALNTGDWALLHQHISYRYESPGKRKTGHTLI